jgi:hypothetical protein
VTAVIEHVRDQCEVHARDLERACREGHAGSFPDVVKAASANPAPGQLRTTGVSRDFLPERSARQELDSVSPKDDSAPAGAGSRVKCLARRGAWSSTLRAAMPSPVAEPRAMAKTRRRYVPGGLPLALTLAYACVATALIAARPRGPALISLRGLDCPARLGASRALVDSGPGSRGRIHRALGCRR